MAAMTMSYQVRDAKEFAGLKPGDLITSTLVVVSNGAYLKDVKKVGEAPLEAGAGRRACAPASSGFELLKPGEAVPDAAVRGSGRQAARVRFVQGLDRAHHFHLHQVSDAHVLSADGSTLRGGAGQAEGQSRPEERPPGERQLRPGNRYAAVLKKHAAALGADRSRWTFLTGDRDEIDRFAARFGIAITREMDDPTNITHNLRTAIVDAKGSPGQGVHGQRVDSRPGDRRPLRRCRARTDRKSPRSAPSRHDRAAAAARVYRARAAPHRAAAHADRGPALSERARLQHRAGASRRDPSQLPRRRPARLCPLPRSGALRGGHPRTTRLSAAASSASNRSMSSITSSSCTGAADAGDRWRDRAIPACTEGKRSSPRRGRWR